MILASFDQKTLTKMEIALERACDFVSTGNQKHRSRRYIAERIIRCASDGSRDLDSLTAVAVAAAEDLNASRSRRSRGATTSGHDIQAAKLSKGVPGAVAPHKESAHRN
jgi:hypothetical protein